jgi:hypothetical protein
MDGVRLRIYKPGLGICDWAGVKGDLLTFRATALSELVSLSDAQSG